MNEHSVSQGGSILTSGSEFFKELYSILQESGRDISGLNQLLGHIAIMELFVKRAEDNIAAMKLQLAEIKEVQNHPLKNSLQNTISALESKIAEVKEQLSELKNDLIQGCKNAIAAFKGKGISALNDITSFFHIKNGLQRFQKNIDGIISANDKAVEKIEAFAYEYHQAEKAVKNMVRVSIGRQPLDPQKEAGKLAKGFAAPYRAQKNAMLGLQKTVEKAITTVDRLEQSDKARKTVRTEGQRRSMLKNLDAYKKRIEREKREMPAPARAAKLRSAEL